MPGASTKPPAAIVIVTLPLPVPVALVAVSATAKVPACVGVPEITPLPAVIPSPGGKPLAPNLLAPAATTVKLKVRPTVPLVLVALVMTGAFSV